MNEYSMRETILRIIQVGIGDQRNDDNRSLGVCGMWGDLGRHHRRRVAVDNSEAIIAGYETHSPSK